MVNLLDKIIAEKIKEVESLRNDISKTPQGECLRARKNNFKSALQQPGLSVIAEIKRKSPSKGEFASIPDPVQLAELYIKGGAAALSILTDQPFFSGKMDDLSNVSKCFPNIPTLRKDFIIDPIQIAEAVYAGADAVLLIVSVLKEKTKELVDAARAFHIDALVEVYDHDELQCAVDAGAEMIAVNNRNLNTFVTDPLRALNFVSLMPDSIVKIAASGIETVDMAKRYSDAGYDAVLIGEALVKSADPQSFIRACRHG